MLQPNKHHLVLLLVALMMLGINNSSLAKDASLYNIEVLIFKRTHQLNDSELLSHTNPYPVLSRAIELRPYFEPQTLTYSDTKAQNKQLSYAKSLLNKSGNYHVILHKKWVQPLTSSANFSVLLKDGANLNTNPLSLLTNSKFKKPIPQIKLIYSELFLLHSGTNLGPTEPQYSFMQQLLHFNFKPLKPLTRELIGTFEAKAGKYIEVTLNLYLHNLNPTLSPSVNFKLFEQRKVNLNELNYFDHPCFGAIVTISKHSDPE